MRARTEHLRAASLPKLGLILAALLPALLLGGCAASKHPDRGRSGQVAATCADKAECDLLWRRAQAWVELNTKRPVNNATDWMIITEPPGTFDASPTLEIKRWADPKGGGEIRIDSFCSSLLPCIPGKDEVLREFSWALGGP
jgi:hypothetical protein